ncbi:MAG: hypothetical protein H7315_19535 [Herminiimonas sp.]|nr:hypothetical protein [Herminiimonas sp.]
MDTSTVMKNLRWKPKVADCVLLVICVSGEAARLKNRRLLQLPQSHRSEGFSG